MRTNSSSFLGGLLAGAVVGATLLMLLSPQARGGMMAMAGNGLGRLWRRGRGRGRVMEMLPAGAR